MRIFRDDKEVESVRLEVTARPGCGIVMLLLFDSSAAWGLGAGHRMSRSLNAKCLRNDSFVEQGREWTQSRRSRLYEPSVARQLTLLGHLDV